MISHNMPVSCSLFATDDVLTAIEVDGLFEVSYDGHTIKVDADGKIPGSDKVIVRPETRRFVISYDESFDTLDYKVKLSITDYFLEIEGSFSIHNIKEYLENHYDFVPDSGRTVNARGRKSIRIDTIESLWENDYNTELLSLECALNDSDNENYHLLKAYPMFTKLTIVPIYDGLSKEAEDYGKPLDFKAELSRLGKMRLEVLSRP